MVHANKNGSETLINSKINIRLRKNNNDKQSNVISGKISCENISPTIIEPKINIKRWGDENEVSNAIKILVLEKELFIQLNSVD